MLWDRGTWEPDHGDPREHLARGPPKFYLYGERLRGRWMLVRTKGYGGKSQNSWLLFKERDEEVRPQAEFDAMPSGRRASRPAAPWTRSPPTSTAVWHSTASVEENVAETIGLHPAPAVADRRPRATRRRCRGARRSADAPRASTSSSRTLVQAQSPRASAGCTRSSSTATASSRSSTRARCGSSAATARTGPTASRDRRSGRGAPGPSRRCSTARSW